MASKMDKLRDKVKVRGPKISFGRLSYYFKIWIFMSKNSFLKVLVRKKLFFMFLLGKILRFIFFGVFLYFIVTGSGELASYSVEQIIFFFLTFNVVDVFGQFFYREVYRFRPMLISGEFDLVLTKPMNSLFRILMGGSDVIDLVTIPLLIAAVIFVGSSFNPDPLQIILYILLIINAMIIATAFHVAVASLAIITLEIDHSIMMYRDILDLGKLPIDIYKEPLRSILTFVLPVGIMITLPGRVLMGLASPAGIVASFVVAMIVIFVAFRLWNFALKYYTSASS